MNFLPTGRWGKTTPKEMQKCRRGNGGDLSSSLWLLSLCLWYYLGGWITGNDHTGFSLSTINVLSSSKDPLHLSPWTAQWTVRQSIENSVLQVCRTSGLRLLQNPSQATQSIPAWSSKKAAGAGEPLTATRKDHYRILRSFSPFLGWKNLHLSVKITRSREHFSNTQWKI